MRTKTILLGIVGCILVCITSCISLESRLSLKKIKDRQSANIEIPRDLKETIDNDIQEVSDESDLEEYCVEKTADYLTFAEHNDISNHKANCVGYAKLCASVYNYLCRKHGYQAYAKPVVGYVYFNESNLCSAISDLAPEYRYFFKDHDFVEFHTPREVLIEDPTAYDLIGTGLKQTLD